jgi:hypothetical protein
MKNKNTCVSKSLVEVWSLKDAVGREVKDLPTDQALKKILNNAHAVAKKYKLRSNPSVCPARETRAKYGKKD